MSAAAPPAEPLDPAHFLGPNGPVARALGGAKGGYEERQEQIQMATHVAQALSSGGHLLVEAGTGVGKSFAYLVPALIWARATGRRVGVATSTIALQEQLVRQDLPLLAGALPFPVRYALVKGRSNYLCARRMFRAHQRMDGLFESEERQALQAIVEWSYHTADGSRQDLPFQPPAEVWEAVQAEQGNCLGQACAHFEGCAWQRSRRRGQEAELLILNHHLLLSDLAMRRTGVGFLPDLDAVILDEAHDLEDTAAEHLGRRVSALGLRQVLARLWNPARQRGLLAEHQDAAAQEAVRAARRAADGFFEQLGAARTRASEAGQGAEPSAGVPLPDASAADLLCQRLEELSTVLLAATRRIGEREAGLELTARARTLLHYATELKELLLPDDTEQVRWVEGSRATHASLCSAPVDVGPLLHEVLFEAHHCVVLTSATLATGRPPSFEYIRSRLGIADAREVRIGSPFDFQMQARLRVSRRLPDPVRAPSAYLHALGPAVLDAVQRTEGGTLVLFTSLRDMRHVADTVRSGVERLGLRLLVQGQDLERPALLEAFRQGSCVLLGVSSFWQGVDVPGDALQHVVIARLPFEVPTHPLQQARAQRVRATGGDPFAQLSLPAAALRLKQGFGRLIRRRTDQGLVTILDPRLVARSYGRTLLDSLPECPVEWIDDEHEPLAQDGS